MRFTTFIGISLIALGLTHCKNDGKSEEKAKTNPATPAKKVAKATPTHAPADFKPGSYEDWCGGHQVPESLCTRCNASLIPAFKKTGDWCAKHNMPESQCLACNPGLKIKRPPKPAGK
jgi:hypothetical protein